MKVWPLAGITAVASLLVLAHWFVYSTWIGFLPPLAPAALTDLRAVFTVCAFSFVAATMLSFQSAARVVNWIYVVAATWLGLFNYLFWAALLTRLVWLVLRLSAPALATGKVYLIVGLVPVAAAVLVSLYGILNARIVRVREHAVTLAGLPAAWRGRRALLMSDIHLGHVNGVGFARRLVRMANQLKPDVIFLPGDLFDGGRIHVEQMLEPFRALHAPLGKFFSSGNHDEFGDMDHYTRAIEQVGICVLRNQAVDVEGLRILGVDYGDSVSPVRMQALLQTLVPDPAEASVLLNHVPSRLPISAAAGISLHLSGHTHGGQFAPFTWITRRIFGPYTHGLTHFGAMTVYTSTGAGAWGPPMRVGTQSEIVVLRFV